MINQESNGNGGQAESHASLVERLAEVPTSMLRLIEERTNDDLRQPGRDGGLAVVEILCDQQDWEEITGERVARILREERPELESYDDSLWSIEHDYISRNGDEVMEAFSQIRAQLVAILAELDEEAWQRTATLADHGEVTLEWLMERVLAHDEQHIEQIMEALA